ncbi:MAG: hypothetical protein IH965_12640 [Gemmatimonadetes bacterium]|nr:hypothetical protein [Gemmatimonadota bacterium]
MRKLIVAVVAVALLGIAASGVQAQQRRPGIREVHKHSGFWLSFGAGGGWEDTDFDFGNRGRGGAAYLRLGGTVNPRVLLGGEVLVWFNQSRGADFTRVNATVSALLYPSLGGGWFLKPGFGVASYEVAGFERTGVATTIGTGFDLRVGRNLYVTPNVDYQVQFFDDATVGSLLFTVGVTWH